ncbi:hypothetical protein EJ05DRAFT_2865 [Pseudovirgaria hyperparasitica]|uniref:Uncharacterized protein n=1 Tax=Pseudovirgaria hyperparasitica TaxID=470096 RepID=A0A6A6WK07_9PEZI|nr:uncharacterized protein EJ05DRAFT_2865 [Pseudovirgaria hyperparasitica]KAF2762477.1 hypothetical protein EJ05DRAFT_2865 [Pseudovirgaria hyperparasitica]
MAGEVPKEPRLQEEKDVPGSFPETPGATPAGEAQTFSVNPIPASEGVGNPIHLAAGEPVPDPSTFNSNTIASTVEDGVTSQPDAEADTFSVAPIPATAGIGNPVTLAPGEKVPDPSTLTSNTVQSTVEDATPEPEAEKTFSVAPIPATAGIGNPITLAPNEAVPDPSTLTSNTIESTVEDDAKADTLPQENGKPSNGSAMFGVPPVTSTLIPESSLPMGGGDAAEDVVAGPFISSAGAGTTTADLAGQVPKEPRAAPSDPTIQSVAPESTTAALAAEVPKETREAPADPTISSAGAGTTTAALAAEVPKETAEVPEIVSESQAAADAAPEASANTGNSRSSGGGGQCAIRSSGQP